MPSVSKRRRRGRLSDLTMLLDRLKLERLANRKIRSPEFIFLVFPTSSTGATNSPAEGLSKRPVSPLGGER